MSNNSAQSSFEPVRGQVSWTELRFNWPDGTPLLASPGGHIAPGRTGLIGPNGAGKTTLLRLIAGVLTPSAGTLTARGTVVVQSQGVAQDASATLADLLGLGPVLRSLEAIEAGRGEPADFDRAEGNWDVADRALAELNRLGIPAERLDASGRGLSGGQVTLLALLGTRMQGGGGQGGGGQGGDITLWDEPTNYLDTATREQVYGWVEQWRGTLIVSSHDDELLRRLDHTVHCEHGEIHTSSLAPLDYLTELDAKRERAEIELREAQLVAAQKTELRRTAEVTLARRKQAGDKAQREKRVPKIVGNGRRAAAENSAAKLRSTVQNRERQAREHAEELAAARVRDRPLRLELPAVTLADSAPILKYHDADGTAEVLTGPGRWLLAGRNGAGKSTELRRLACSGGFRDPWWWAEGAVEPGVVGRARAAGVAQAAGAADEARAAEPLLTALTDRVGYLAQSIPPCDPRLTAVEVLRHVAEDWREEQLFAQLARYGLRGESGRKPLAVLSGGEIMRLRLASLFAAQSAPELLILDEPTAHIDRDSTQALVGALRAYGGAILVVCHDLAVTRALGVSRTITVRR